MTPRGIRNNNPLNIRIGRSQWLGRRRVNTDGVFEQFQTMEYGIRAAFVLIRRYMEHYGRNTVRKIISAWAPPTDGNHTETYIRQVAHHAELDPDEPLQFGFPDKDTMCTIVEEMIRVECGKYLPPDTIARAYDMAAAPPKP